MEAEIGMIGHKPKGKLGLQKLEEARKGASFLERVLSADTTISDFQPP